MLSSLCINACLVFGLQYTSKKVCNFVHSSSCTCITVTVGFYSYHLPVYILCGKYSK